MKAQNELQYETLDDQDIIDLYKRQNRAIRIGFLGITLTVVFSVYTIVVSLLLSQRAVLPPDFLPFAYVPNSSEKQILTPLMNVALSDQNVLNRAKNIAAELLSMHFNKTVENVKSRKKYFSKEGYDKYVDAIVTSERVQDIRSNNKVVTATNLSKPILVRKYVEGGVMHWYVVIQMLETVEGLSDRTITDKKLVQMILVEVDRQEFIEGVQIKSFIVN